MFIIELVVVYDNWNGKSNDFVFVFNINLFFGEGSYLCFIVGVRLSFFYVGVYGIY